MSIDYLLKKFEENSRQEAIIWQDKPYHYDWLLQETNRWMKEIACHIQPNAVVDLSADFSPRAVAILLALIAHRCIIVPMTSSVESKKADFQATAQVEYTIRVDEHDQVDIHTHSRVINHPMLCQLKSKQNPGLILFSSGSTGKNKAAVHDFSLLLKKFEKPRHSKRIITFLLFDHIGGINTLLYTLYNAGCVIAIQRRAPHDVCQVIEKYNAQILPTSPTFLNLLLVSGAYKEYNLSSLELVTYGTEVMPESTLKQFHTLFPHIRLQQTYGLSEIGILRSKSKSSDSLYMRVGGEGFETRIVDGMLEVKAASAMLGYLNAESPFTEDGWFKTGDAVEVEGEYIKTLGRRSEMINVGGEKVYPIQVESVLQSMTGVSDVAVCGEPHPLTGQIVKAVIHFHTDHQENVGDFRKRMRQFCQGKLLNYQIPQKVVVLDHALHGDRFKKIRRFAS
ncbi:MAG: fatty acid--CoA ligase family protein [Pseudomonadota bacterium]